MIDAEAVLLGVDGISDFDGLHSRKFDAEVQLYAFDALMLDGDDLRQLPLSMRKTNLARLLARRPEGIFVRAATYHRSPSYEHCTHAQYYAFAKPSLVRSHGFSFLSARFSCWFDRLRETV